MMKLRMKPVVFLLICLLNFLISIQAQESNSFRLLSLKKSLPELKGNARIHGSLAICKEYFDQGFFGQGDKRVDSIKLYASLAYQQSDSKDYNRGKAEAALMLGFVEKCNFRNKEALKYFEETISLSNEDPYLLGRAYGLLGSIYFEGFRDPVKGASYLKQSVRQFQVSGNEKEEGLSLTHLCMIYSSIGRYEEGIDYCTRSVTLARKNPYSPKNSAWQDYQYLQSTSSLIGLYKLAGNLNDALLFQHQINQYIGQRKLNIDTDLDMGTLYGQIGNYDSSIIYLEKYIGKNPAIMWAVFQLGKTYLMKHDLDKAEELLQRCIDSFSRRNKGATTEVYSVYAGKLYLEKNEPARALQYAREIFRSKQINNERLFLLDKYDFLSNAYYLNGIPDSAFLYFKKYTSLRDSGLGRQYVFKLNNYQRDAEDQKRVAELLVLAKDNQLKQQLLKEQELLQQQKENQLILLNKDYKLKEQELNAEAFLRKEKETQLLLLNKEHLIQAQQLEKKDFLRNMLIASLIGLVLVAFFIVRSFVLKRKNDKLKRERLETDVKMHQLETQARQAEWYQKAIELEMKAMHAQMNPHFIFNCLSSINLFIMENQSKEASIYLTRFSRLIRMVLVNSQKSLIPLDEELSMLQLYLDMERLRFVNVFDYNIKIDKEVPVCSIKVPPLLLQPFCENSIWHGLMQKEGNKTLDIEVSLKGKMLECKVIDNGVGRPKTSVKKNNGKEYKSMGLQISRERLALLKRTENLESSFDIEDLEDVHGNPLGTKVTIKIGEMYNELDQ